MFGFYTKKSNRFGCLFLFSCLLFFAGCSANRAERLSQAENYLSSGNVREAKAIYSTLLQHNEMDSHALRGMVQATQISGATKEHLAWCQKLLKPIPWDRHANIVVGNELAETGNLKDAAMRYIFAYQNSIFKEDKREVLNLLSQLKRLELEEINHFIEKQDGK